MAQVTFKAMCKLNIPRTLNGPLDINAKPISLDCLIDKWFSFSHFDR